MLGPFSFALVLFPVLACFEYVTFFFSLQRFRADFALGLRRDPRDFELGLSMLEL